GGATFGHPPAHGAGRGRAGPDGESRLGSGSGTAPAPQPQPTHVAGRLRCTASASTTSPADYHTVYIYVRTTPGLSVTTVAHYKPTDNRKTAVADGRAGP